MSASSSTGLDGEHQNWRRLVLSLLLRAVVTAVVAAAAAVVLVGCFTTHLTFSCD